MTQAKLAELAGLSLKYIGEIERGEANTSLDSLERVAEAMDWDPMELLEGAPEPLSEGVRLFFVAELQLMQERVKMMTHLLHSLDPSLHPGMRKEIPTGGRWRQLKPEVPRLLQRRLKGARGKARKRVRPVKTAGQAAARRQQGPRLKKTAAPSKQARPSKAAKATRAAATRAVKRTKATKATRPARTATAAPTATTAARGVAKATKATRAAKAAKKTTKTARARKRS